MKTILLTRSREDNLELKDFLDTCGIFSPVFCPLISYKTLPFDPAALKGYTDIIITSRYAATILAARLKEGLRYWVVGEHSAAILTAAGLDVVYSATNVQDLVGELPPDNLNNFAYLSGNEITMKLPVDRFIVYAVEYASTLTPELLEAMNRGIDYIVIYSQNSAKTLVTLCARHNLLNILKKATIIAISAKVADQVRSYSDRVIYCSEGNAKEMMEVLIDDAKKQGS